MVGSSSVVGAGMDVLLESSGNAEEDEDGTLGGGGGKRCTVRVVRGVRKYWCTLDE